MKKMCRLPWGMGLIILSFLLINCEQKSSTGPGTQELPAGIIGNVSLTADDVELYAVPGATAQTKVYATVTDTAGTAVQGVLVHFSTPEIGSISSTQDSTDSDGKVFVTFNSQGEYGLATITASVTTGGETVSGSITIGVYPLTGVAHDITISLDPDVFYLDSGTEDSSKVTIRVMDSLNVGIPGLQVSLSTTLGVITFADTTDNTGTAVTYVHTNEEYGMGIVTASVNTSLPDTGSTPPDTTLSSPPPIGPQVKMSAKQGGAIADEFGYIAQNEGLSKNNKSSEPPQTEDVYTISDTDTFWVFPIDQQIAGISIGAWPSVLSVAPDTIGTAMIVANVVDPNNIGIAGVPLSFATDLGMLALNTGTTDSTGTLTTTYYSSANAYGTAKVWVVVGPLSDTCTVIISPTASANGTLMLFSDTNLIYADNGITTAQITALLKDADNQVISNDTIIFTSDYGTVNSPVLTDSSGLAQATFTDLGFASYPDSATIIAKYSPLSITDSVRIMIADARGIDHIVLSVGNTSMIANNVDSTVVYATVYLENGDLAPAGTDVNFIVGGDEIGTFSQPIAQVEAAGKATVYYRVGNSTGTDTLKAEVDEVYSNAVAVQLNSGPPTQVDLDVDPSTLSVNSLEMATVTATVRDTTGNLVDDNYGVYFSTTLGSVSPAEAPTIDGVATSYLAASTNAGTGWVKAQVGLAVDSTLVTFVPSTPSQIGLSAQYATIQVAGTGGNYQTKIYAHVRDAAGNYVGNDVMVHFKIQNNGFPGGGININNHDLEDSTMTNGGIAAVVLNAGTTSGPVTIKAWTFDDEQTEIWAEGPLVTIVSGPPDWIDIGIPNGDVLDAGGDSWQLEISALVLDSYGNEVVDSTAVQFYVVPNSESVQIWGDGFTGNENWDGDTYEGIAFTTLTYHSDATFDSIWVYAYTMVNGDSVLSSIQFQLPLAEGQLELSVVPIAWNFDYPPPGYTGDPARMKCIAQLKDGHELPIDGGEIVFYSTRGSFYYKEFPENFPPPATQYFGYYATTGPDTSSIWEEQNAEGSGTCWLYLLTSFPQAFPDPNAIETTGQIHCEVVGYYDISSDPITVTYTQSP